ncbi:unnamed protein product, partial [Effrenium voratum]
EGAVQPSNAKQFFLRQKAPGRPVVMERCTANPEACLELERCAEGHAGRQCRRAEGPAQASGK